MIFENNHLKFKDNLNYFIIFFFIFFLIVGLFIYDDFGMPYDALEYRQQGLIILNHIGNFFFPEITKSIIGSKNIVSVHDYQKGFIFSGVPFHSSHALIEKIFFDFQSKKEVYYFKYVFTFLFNFIGCIFFYLLLKERFNDKILSLIGVAILISSPRIFPELFYNPNDIPFMTSTIIFFYFAKRYFTKSSNRNLILISLVSGFLVSMRFGGLVYPMIFVFIYFLYDYFFLKKPFVLVTKRLLIFILLFLTFSYLFNPSLWNNFLNTFYLSINTSISYDLIFPKILYLGKFYDIKNLPWHYLLVWIGSSTPILYLFFICIGILTFLFTFKKEFNSNEIFFDSFLFFSLIFFLLAVIFISKSIINGWRHMYFLYPSLIYFSIYSFSIIKLRNFFLVLFILSFFYNCHWIIKNHPHQMVFFNSLAGKDLQNKFELDYWGLSIKNSMLQLLKNNKNVTVIGSSNTRLNFTKNLLTNEEKRRITIVDNVDNANYIISVFNGSKRRKDFIQNGFKVINDIKVDNIIINSTFENLNYKKF